MCGRCAAIVSEADVRNLSGTKTFHGVEKYVPKYNCTPQCYLPCITSGSESTYEACTLRWGVVPAFASSEKDYRSGPVSTFNARSDNLRNSPLWRRLLKKRCVIVVQGYYEWKTNTKAKTKTPYFIHHTSSVPYQCLDIASTISVSEVKQRGTQGISVSEAVDDTERQYNAMRLSGVKLDSRISTCKPDTMYSSGSSSVGSTLCSHDDDNRCTLSVDLDRREKADVQHNRPLLIAGLYDEWRNGEETLRTCAILTMSSMGQVTEGIHDRAPVLLDEESARLWLTKAEFEQVFPPIMKTAKRIGENEVSCYEVSTLVSNIKNEHADCLLPRAEYNTRQLDIGIERFGGSVRRVTKRKRSLETCVSAAL